MYRHTYADSNNVENLERKVGSDPVECCPVESACQVGVVA